jgi:nucleoid-associated protein EbfC
MKDIAGLMKQAQAMQQKMQETQASLDTTLVEGVSGGGMVRVTLTAKGDMRGVVIEESLLKPQEKDILEDLLMAAHADARKKAESIMSEKMQAVTGGLSLPAGFKLPF